MSGLFDAKDFWRELIDLGVEVLEKVDEMFRQSRYSGNSVRKVPEMEMLTSSAGLFRRKR